MKSIKEYLSRVGKARGFGIQSPWAYRFVTEIVGERLPYYCYEEIERQYSGRREQKFQKFLCRLRNFTYPSEVLVIDITNADNNTLSAAITQCSEKGAIVLRGINSSKDAHRQWLSVRQHDNIGVTFDMYDFAVCFLDTTMFKQHYKLNF